MPTATALSPGPLLRERKEILGTQNSQELAKHMCSNSYAHINNLKLKIRSLHNQKTDPNRRRETVCSLQKRFHTVCKRLIANQKAWKRERLATTKVSKAGSSQRDRYKSHPLSLWQDFQLTRRSHDISKRHCFKRKKSGPKLFKRDESNVVRIYFWVLMYPITNKYTSK